MPGSALRFLVAIELQEFNERPQLRSGIVVRIAPTAAVKLAALYQFVAVALEIGVALGEFRVRNAK
jgi:hypothetical protein